jgi:hypothetical protein
MLNVVPKVLPHFLLRRTFLVNEIAAYLDVRAVNDGHLWADLADKWDQTRHLWVIWARNDVSAIPERTLIDAHR